MPYDKGDFTQQGINGDVSALVRLNEKRVMKVVLSSDDESDNCDISGKIYDLLNGTSYDIGSGGGGGGDWTTANVLIRNTTLEDFDPAETVNAKASVLYNDEYRPVSAIPVNTTVQVPLYKNTGIYSFDFISDIAWDSVNEVFDVTGNISFDPDEGTFTITGNCEIGVGYEK